MRNANSFFKPMMPSVHKMVKQLLKIFTCVGVSFQLRPVTLLKRGSNTSGDFYHVFDHFVDTRHQRVKLEKTDAANYKILHKTCYQVNFLRQSITSENAVVESHQKYF